MEKIKSFMMHKLFHSFSKNAVISIFMLGLLDIMAMTAPYYLKYIIPQIWNYMGVTQDQYDQIIAVLGWIVLALQIPSGLLADRISSRRMLIMASWGTAFGTLLWALTMQGFLGGNSTKLILYYIIFSLFGVTTTLLLWAPLWKVLSQQGDKHQQGALYGLEGSFNGLIGLLLVTLIGSLATAAASNGNNLPFYILIYVIVIGLCIAAIGIWKFIPETYEKSPVLLLIKRIFSKSKSKHKIKNPNLSDTKLRLKTIFAPILNTRIWLLSFMVLGMYIFQSVYAYYMKSYLTLLIGAGVLIPILGGLRAYGLRMIVSSPFGKWAQKRKSFVLVSIMVFAIGIIFAVIFILLPGVGNTFANLSPSYKLALKIIMPILYIINGTISWCLVTIRYVQIGEIPTAENSYGTTIALISFIAFSTDAWFYQMASILMKTNPQYMDGTSYSQYGLSVLLIISLVISLFGLLCGIIVYIWNAWELKKLGKTDFRWREMNNKKIEKDDSDIEVVNINNKVKNIN